MTQNQYRAGDQAAKPAEKQHNGDSKRPDKGGTAGQSGGEEAKNRSSNPDAVRQ